VPTPNTHAGPARQREQSAETAGLSYGTRFPQPSPPISAVTQRLALLDQWRMGATATAIVMAGLLPFAVAWHVRHLVGIATSLVAAAAVAILSHVARELHLARLSIYPEFEHLPDLARKRRQIASPRNRQRLAQELRRTMRPAMYPSRFDACPLLHDRIATVQPVILEIAAALEDDCTPDPVYLALLGELLHAGASPLYNPNVDPNDLHRILDRVRDRLPGAPAA
jgi:hypothetical protein